MNKKILLTIFAGILTAGLLSANTTFAAPPDLQVQFEQSPLFNEANFAPGNTVTRFIKITNNTNGNKPAQVEAINVSDADNLSAVINFKVTEASTTLFSGTLKDFFDKHEQPLDNIAGGTTAQYNFSATFQPTAGNQYQSKKVGFDLLAGFQGQVQGGGNGNGNGGGGGGGGGSSGNGGGSTPPGLSISENSVTHILKSATSLNITWTTSYLSTSQVIYSAANEPHQFNIGAPNYGYAHATPEASTFVTDHSVTLTGLKPNTTYFYRVISHASPPSVSFEHSFTTPGELAFVPASGTSATPQTTQGQPAVLGQAIIKTGNNFNSPAKGKVLGESTSTTAQAPSAITTQPTSAAENSPSQSILWKVVLAAALLVLVIWLAWEKYGRK